VSNEGQEGRGDLLTAIQKIYLSLESSLIGLISRTPFLLYHFKRECSMRAVVFVFIAAIAFISFNTAYIITSVLYKRHIHQAAQALSSSQADNLKLYMLELMKRGVSKGDIKSLVNSSGIKDSALTMRAEVLSHIGDASLPQDKLLALKAGVKTTLIEDGMVREFYPLKAEAGCLACHRGANLGDLLGLLTIQLDLKPVISGAERKIAWTFFVLLPIPITLIALSVLLLNAKLSIALNNFRAKIDAISSVKDLTTLQITTEDIGFSELTSIADELNSFSRRIKGVAVDREILEFEIRILEKFIITSEMVKDWKEHVANLLMEINKVLSAYTLFSIFQVDDEVYDLEIFWYDRPCEETLSRFENIVKEKVRARQRIFAVTNMKITHNMVRPTAPKITLDEREIDFQTKTLILDTPQIGGVVGIGVQASLSQDPIRSVVIDGILTTLINVVGSIKAIYKYTKDLEYYATRDPLTNLYNQRIFWELLGYEINRAERHRYKFSLLVIDLDNFKNINDSYGHAFGDKYLRAIADAIRSALRQGDILGRYGGDEFAVVLPEADEEQGFSVATRIREYIDSTTLTTPDGGGVKATASVGLAVFPTHAANAKDLFIFADSMMYRAKQQGKNTVLAPTAEDVMEVFKKTSDMTLMVIKAIEERAVIPFYQPIVNLSTNDIEALEVLSRIRYKDQIFSASEFIEIAEKTGMVNRLDHDLIEKVFHALSETDFKWLVFINLSPKSLILKDFIAVVVKHAIQHGIDFSRIVFELKERDIIKNLSLVEKFAYDLHLQGFKFAVDDFGSGYSLFRYIRNLPIDFVKIDETFIKRLAIDPKDYAFVKSISLFCKDLGIKTVAESIEESTVHEKARLVGVDYGQGFYIGPPSEDMPTNTKGQV